MARLALAALLLLSARALADEGCAADGTCQADEDENAALLQKSAAHKAKVTQHSHANTTETTTLTCYPNHAAATCGGSMKCFKDTSGCTSSGGGVCCKAAGNGAGLEQCKFCGDSTCGPCPQDGPAGLGENCGTCGSTGQTHPHCEEGLVCTPPQNELLGSCSTCQVPAGNQVGDKCGNSPDGHYYGECMDGLVCAPPADAAMGTTNTCANICGNFGQDGDHMTGGCNRMQSCSCRAETPCSSWAQGAEGCYMYCC